MAALRAVSWITRKYTPCGGLTRLASSIGTDGNGPGRPEDDPDPGTSGEPLDEELVGMHRSSFGAALRQVAPRRFEGGFRGRRAAQEPLVGPIARMATARPRDGEAAIMREYEASLRTMYASADGCLGAYLLWDRDKGEATSLTLWASTEHLRALTATDDYSRRMKAFGALLVGIPEVRTVQLLASVGPSSPNATTPGGG